MSRKSLLLLGAVSLLPALALASNTTPRGVSPGSPLETEPLSQTCPTFSWTAVDGAEGYELVVYRVSSSGVLSEVLRREIPPGATSWTPPAGRCLTGDADYAWVLRALGKKAASWSDPLLFTTAGPPSDDEVRRALAVLRIHRGVTDRAQPQRSGSHSISTSAPELPFAAATAQEPARQTPRVSALAAETLGAHPRAQSSPQAVVTPPTFSLNLNGALNVDGAVFKGGDPLIHTDGGATYGNTALGLNALVSATPGSPYPGFGRGNSAFGRAALAANDSGFDNTAIGYRALDANTNGATNTAVGSQALGSNVIGTRNTAVGFQALFANTGSRNTAGGYRALYNNESGFNHTAIGYRALFKNTTGTQNTAIGYSALFNNETGFSNTAIGRAAGYSWTTGNHNIAIGNGSYGAAGEGGTIRIGGSNRQTRTFVEGIRGATSDDDIAGFDQEVCVDQFDQLGPCTVSSARFKREIEEMDDIADRAAALRPVTFRYRHQEDDEAWLHYGLIAEEVAEIFPGLVTYDAERKPYSVRYQLLTPLLLKELQRQAEEIAVLKQLVAEVADRPADPGKADL